MIPIGNQFGFIGGVSWLVILLTIVFLFFILITVCAKKDSWVRALAYTAVSSTPGKPAPRPLRSWPTPQPLPCHPCMHVPAFEAPPVHDTRSIDPRARGEHARPHVRGCPLRSRC
jgi:hypothetical protein